MRDRVRILVVGGGQGLAEEVRHCIAESQPEAAVQWLRDAAVALARVGGGDIDALVIDPASIGVSPHDLPAWLERLQEASKGIQTIVVSESRDWTGPLRRLVGSSARRKQAFATRPLPGRGRKLRIIGFLGAKGGAGTTTVALNTACALGEKHAVVLAELGSGNDNLTLHLRTTAKSAWPSGSALDGLWSVREISGLRLALAQDIFRARNGGR